MTALARRTERVAKVRGFLETAEHHRRKEVVSMWHLGEHAQHLLYDHRLTHNQVVSMSGISMFELTRALTIRATYSTVEQIPEGK